MDTNLQFPPFDAMIFAAGLGTRLKPLTNKKPKALVEVNGKPMLKHILSKLKHYNVQRIIINVHHFSEQMINYLADNENFGLDIFLSNESNELLDTGGGLKKASTLFSGKHPILLHNVDLLSDIDLNNFLIQHKANKALATLAIRKRNDTRYFLFDANYTLVGWTNTITNELIMSRITIDPIKYGFSGIHIIEPKLLPLITEKGVFSIVDVYLRLAKKYLIKGYDHTEDVWLDVGNPQLLSRAEKLLSNNS